MMNKKGIPSEGLITILYLMMFVAFLGIAIGGITRGFGQANNIGVNETILGNLDSNNATARSVESMKLKFVDNNGNARTGITDIINTLFTGIGGIITVLFQSPVTLANVFGQIANSMGLLGAGASSETLSLVGAGIEFIVVIIIIGTVYMISRRT